MNNNYEVKQMKKGVVEVDVMSYFLKLWKNRVLLLKSIGVGLLAGIIIAFSIPKTYKAIALLAPESTQNANNQMAGMAAMLGISGMAGQNGRDAINISRAENIVSTTPFLLELRDVKVQTIDGKTNTTIVDYISSQKSPWWNTLFSLPFKAVGGILSIFKDKTEKVEQSAINPFHLTPLQARQIASIKNAIHVEINKSTGMIEVSTTFQDPLVAALITDSVMVKLQDFIIRYRTNKAQQDCDYLDKLYKESQQKYYDAQNLYARYTDSNLNVVRKTASTESVRLLNEMNLAYQIYSQVATQLQMAHAKVQEVKPSFTIVEPSSVPLHPNGPNKKIICIGFLLLSFISSSAWILFGKDLYIFIKKSIKQNTYKQN